MGSMGICMALRTPETSVARFGKVKPSTFRSNGPGPTLKHMIHARPRRCGEPKESADRTCETTMNPQLLMSLTMHS
eukprot:7464364-Lingulodinium_polyedra.AAC.1